MTFAQSDKLATCSTGSTETNNQTWQYGWTEFTAWTTDFQRPRRRTDSDSCVLGVTL